MINFAGFYHVYFIERFCCYVLFNFLLYSNLEAGAASKINPAIILFVSQLF